MLSLLAIVIYDECIETPLPLTKMTPEGKVCPIGLLHLLIPFVT